MQARPADEVVVVARCDDVETWVALKDDCWSRLPLKAVAVGVPGVVQAMNTGLEVTCGAIVAITDDDAAPWADWLERIEAHFQADQQVGGVGGRDWLHFGHRTEDGEQPTVGKLRWFGRTIGNHHLGIGEPREVDVLKGVNCAYRAEALKRYGFDTRLRGRGAQVHWELSLGLSLRRHGWKLIYDPVVAVDHYPGERQDEDVRGRFNAEALADATHNETLTLLEHLPVVRRAAYLLWGWGVGDRAAPGLGQWLRLWPTEGSLATARWRAAAHGRAAGWKTWRQHRSARSFGTAE